MATDSVQNLLPYPDSSPKPSGDEGNDAEISGAKAADSNAPTEAEESLEEEIRRKKEGVLSVARIKKEKCIDMLQRTFDASSVAYIRLDCSRKSLKDISILENYQHLRFINLSNNQLEDVSPVNICRHLLVLNVDNNLIETLELRDCLYMKVLSAAHNKLSKFSGMPVCVANLVNLNLNGNNIDDSLENLPKMDRLKRLQIRGNKLNTLEMSTPNLASLEEIFAADNEIDSIKIDRQAAPQSLRLLHLRDNKLDGSPGTSISDTFKKLKYLNLRNNRIEKLDQLESLIKNHPNLEKLILKGNGIVDDLVDYRVQIHSLVRNNLRVLDKTELSEEEISISIELNLEKEGSMEPGKSIEENEDSVDY